MRLEWGAKKVTDDFNGRLNDLLKLTDDPKLQSAIVDLKIIFNDDVKPLCYRAPAEPSSEMRERRQNERISAIEARLDARESLLTKVEQLFAQTEI